MGRAIVRIFAPYGTKSIRMIERPDCDCWDLVLEGTDLPEWQPPQPVYFISSSIPTVEAYLYHKQAHPEWGVSQILEEIDEERRIIDKIRQGREELRRSEAFV